MNSRLYDHRSIYGKYDSISDTEEDENNEHAIEYCGPSQEVRASVLRSLAFHDNQKKDSPTTSTLGSSESSQRSSSQLPRPVSFRARITALLFGLLMLSILAAMPHMPTTEEIELARDYDLNLWSHISKLRSAQKLADISRLSLITSTKDSGFKHILKKIEKRNGAKHYIEPPVGCEATIVIVRHCEKGDVREHCALIGYERSVYLATLFGDTERERWPAPSYIFAEGPGARHNKRKMNFREIETVGPLARKSGVTIDDSYNSHTVNKLASRILTEVQTGQMCGKVALISWKHSNIAHLAHHLGCGPMQGCPLDYRGKTFDNAWQMKFVYTDLKHSSHKNLKSSPRYDWHIFGSVQPEGFDPLAFSKFSGDYPRGGTNHGIRWQSEQVEIPERKKGSTTPWKATRVGFHEDGEANAADDNVILKSQK